MAAAETVSIVCPNCGKAYSLSRRYFGVQADGGEDGLVVTCVHCQRDDVISRPLPPPE